MLELCNGGLLVQSTDELPRLDWSLIFKDYETTSFDWYKDALNVWRDCWALGVAVCDARSKAYYIPLRHHAKIDPYHNLDVDAVIAWLADGMSRCRRWVNHNVKYDAHVEYNDLGVDSPKCELVCTVTHAKIIDSDRQFRGGYGLDALSLAWLGEDISAFEKEIKRYLGRDGQDYGFIPILPMATYACQDVLTNRRLYKYIEQQRPKACVGVADVETKLTRRLVEMERAGLCVNPTELQLREVMVISRMLECETELHELIGRTINPTSTDDVYDVLVNQYGLPVLHWTEEDEDGNPAGNPSFDKEGMKKYLAYPLAPRRVVELIGEFRKLSTHRSLFLEKYQSLATASESAHGTEWFLHGSYNQCLRTGRMGCREPNAQQLDKKTQELIHPRRGNAIMRADQSQIEFRIIAHYINDSDVIRAYNENPDTDFHDWVAQVAGMARSPAKTMNFMMGYGGGKKKAVRTMAANADVIGNLLAKVEALVEAGTIRREDAKKVFDEMCKQRGEQVYDEYHRTLPTLKSTSRRAAATCAERGYVFNGAGRRRHLPQQHAHVAFNSLCQSFAADIQKERTVALCDAIDGTPIFMIANVHDDTVLEGPIKVMRDRRTQVAVAWILEHTAYELRVPLRVSLGVSELNWREAGKSVKDGGTAGPIMYTDAEREWLLSTPAVRLFDWLRASVDDLAVNMTRH